VGGPVNYGLAHGGMIAVFGGAEKAAPETSAEWRRPVNETL
jgi:hypothetical protein